MKLCGNAGALYFIGYEMDKQPPRVNYAGVDKDGRLEFDVPVALKEVHIPVMPTWAVLCDAGQQ